MRFVKNPAAKRNDPTVPWKQDTFTNIYRDIPASRIPNGGVADAKNVLLYGDRAMVRPGDERHSDTIGLPLDATQPFTSGIAKSGTSVTHSGNGFAATDIGKYLIWDDGSSSLITAFVGAGEVTVDDSTAQADTDVDIRSQIWGNFWHEKSKKIFLHIGTRLFHTPWDFSGGWVEITLPSGSTLTQTRSKFDQEENLIYLFNSSGIILIDVTDEDNISTVQMNMPAPSNNIVPATDETIGAAATLVDHLPSLIETEANRFGRRYLHTMVKLDGDSDNDRGDGTRLIKESGSNTFPSTNDFKDYKESWRINPFKTAGDDSFALSSSSYGYDFSSGADGFIQDFINSIGAFDLTIRTTPGAGASTVDTTRTVVVNCEDDVTWDDIAASFQIALNASFPDNDMYCFFDATAEELLFFDSDPNIEMIIATTPTGSYTDWSSDGTLFSGLSTSGTFINWHVLGTKTTKALQMPSGQFGYTHFGVYSTVELGSGSPAANPEYFIWQKDIPIIKSFIVITKSNGDLLSNITAADGNILEKEDLGCWINFANGDSMKIQRLWENDLNGVQAYAHNEGGSLHTTLKTEGISTGAATNKLIDSGATFTNTTDAVAVGDPVLNSTDDAIAIITAIDSDTQLSLSEDIFPFSVQAYHIGGEPVAIGSEEPMMGTKSGTTVTAQAMVTPKNSVPLFDFVAADVGKSIFWSDGDIDVIVSVTSTTEVEVLKSGTKTYNTAFAFEPTGRNYNDSVTDDVLEARATAFPLLSRFYENLPDSDIGAIVPGFLVVATEDDTKGYYSQYSNAYRYLAGHYYAEYQFFIVPDLIKELSAIPNQLILFCKNSTRRFQTNVVENVNDARVGESIAILAGQGIVDENIGISDRMGVISYGSGYKLVTTSEPGVRIFDGYRYGENKLMDNLGRGHIRESFQILKDRIIAYYEPNLYGIMFWGSALAHVDANGLPLLSKSSRCYRMAVEAQQGFGFSELYGGAWNFIELNSTPMHITDSKGDKFTILFDTNTGYPHRLSTRKLSDTGANTEIDFNHTDNEPMGGGSGTEIPWSIKLKEHIASEENFKLRYMDEYWYLRPFKETNKDASGYDSYGFRDGNRLTVKLYTDGNATEVSEIKTIDPKATIFSPYKVEERRIQAELNGLTSELIITGVKAQYDVLMRRQPPGSQDETIYQDLFSEVKFRISRGYPKSRNLATGSESDSEVENFQEITGPDGESKSAVQMLDNTSYFNYAAPSASYRYVIFSILADISEAGGTVYDEYIDASNSRLKVVLDNANLEFYMNGVLIKTVVLTDLTWYTFMVEINDSDNLVIQYGTSALEITKSTDAYTGSTSIDGEEIRIGEGLGVDHALFDVIIYNSADTTITDDAFLYYVRDLYKYNGFSLLPMADEADSES